MGNKEISSNQRQIPSNSQALPNSQPLRNSSLTRFKPSPLNIEHNNRLLGQKRETSNILKPPPTLQRNDSLPSKNTQNPQNIRSKFEKIQQKTPVEEENNNILSSNSISSYHFNENPARNPKKIAETPAISTKPPHNNGKVFATPQKPRDFFEKSAPASTFPVHFPDFREETQDPLTKMRQYLLSRRRNDFHLRFFKENSDLMYISLPITTQNSKKLTPFRNRKCRTPLCLYDLEEILTKYKDSMFSNYLSFICAFCKQLLDLRDFFLDSTLNKVIDEAWKSYNRVTLQCREITLLRNGLWEPNLPEYLKLLEKNLAKTRKKPRVISNIEDLAQIKPAKSLKKQLKDFSDFSVEELKELEERLLRKSLKPEKTIVYLQDYAITMRDYQQLRDDSAFPVSLMSFFIQFIRDFQEKHYENYSKESGNKTYIFGIKVVKFDKFYKKARFEDLPGPPHPYKGKTSYILELYSLISLMILLENRWICVLIDLNTYDYYPIDFLQEDLS